MVGMETGSRITIWRTFVFFQNGSSYISAANWDTSTKFGLLIDFYLLKSVTSANAKPEVVLSSRGRHLAKWVWRHISAVRAPIWTKFGSLMQNNMQITAIWSRSKSELEFLYGGHLFFENRSSYIAAMNWDMCTKLGLLNTVASTTRKPEEALSGRGRHLEKSIWRHVSAAAGPIWMKFGSLVQNSSMPIAV